MTTDEFKQTFLPCSEQMFLLALRLTDSKADAEDAVQDVFAKLWRGRSGLKSLDCPEAYAMVMVRNRCLDIVAARRDHISLEGVAVPCEEEVANALGEALDTLPEPHRSVMKMRYCLEMSMPDMECQTGLSQGNLRVILSRARNSLRKRFNKI